MTENKDLRALYLKGIKSGATVKVELQKPIGGRTEAGDYVHYANKGDLVMATLTRIDIQGHHVWTVTLADETQHQLDLASAKLRG